MTSDGSTEARHQRLGQRCLAAGQDPRHLGGMEPTERPRNDNWNPAHGDPPEPGLFSTRKWAIESTLSLIGLAVLWGAAFLWLDGAHWRLVGTVIAVAFVGMLIAGIYRLIVHGRA